MPGRPAPPTREVLTQNVLNSYQAAFNVLMPFIAFAASKATDFQGLEREGRAAAQKIKDMGIELSEEFKKVRKEAEDVLALVRKTAAEHGVSQQASYFRQEAEDHEKKAATWRWLIVGSAAVLGLYAIATLFLHKIPSIKPADHYELIQLAISKILIFGVLSFMLYLATKNYLAHKHNGVVNRHRQNALLTYEALVKAAKDTANKEVILTHASACIFAPQDTGYTGGPSTEGPAAKSVVELLSSRVTGGE